MQKRVFLAALMLLVMASTSFAWTMEQNLTPSSGDWLQMTSVAVDTNDNVHVIYIRVIGSDYKVCHRYKAPGGSFTAEQYASSVGTKEPEMDVVAGKSGKIFVATLARDPQTDEYSVFFREWNGSSWSVPIRISDGSSYCKAPRQAVDASGNLHVVWQQTKTGGQGDILYRKRYTNGSWGPIKNITANYPGTSYGSCSPDVACDYSGSGVHVVWHDDFLDDGHQAYYMKSSDGGDTWPGQAGWFQLSTMSYGKVPRVIVDHNNTVHTFWRDRFDTDNTYLAYRKFEAGVWSSRVNLGSKGLHDLCLDSTNTVHLIYDSGITGHLEMYHDWVSGNGLNNSNELVSTGDNTCKAAYGAMAVDSNNVLHAAWQERKGSDCGDGPYIFYSMGIYSPPPPAPTNLQAVGVSSSRIDLSWINPNLSNFEGTAIRYRYDTYPSGPYDGNLLATRPASPGSSDSIIHVGLQPGQAVYYGAFAYNDQDIYGSGAYATARTHSQYNDHGRIGAGSRPFAMAASPDGVVYTGTDGGTFGRYNPSTNTWTDLNLAGSGIYGRVLCLLVHSNGLVYGGQGGTGGGDLWYYNPANGQKVRIWHDGYNQIQGQMVEGPDGKIWFGRGNRDICCYDPTQPVGASNPRVYAKPSVINQYLVGGIAVTSDNAVYACWTSNTAPFDMFRLNPATGQWTRIILPTELNTEYACHALLMANDGYIYGITARGVGSVFKLDPATGAVTSFGSQFPATWGPDGKRIVGGGWAVNGRLYWGSSQDASGNAHMFYFDRSIPAGSYNGSLDNGNLPTDTRDIHSLVYSKGRVYLGVRQDDSTPRLWSFDVAGSAPSPTITDLKNMSNGTTVTLNNKVVTGGFGDHFYIEEMDRLAGIKVASGVGAEAGDMVSVTGDIRVVEGERQINPTSVAIYSGGNGIPEPWAWNIRALGGGAHGDIPGMFDAFGLNNVGLLGRIAGKVVGLGSGSWFYVDDGSNTPADEGFTGVKVLSTASVQLGDTVIVTGISSVDTNSDGLSIRQIKTRSSSDVQIITP